MALNPSLYDLLVRRFRCVRIGNDGESMTANYRFNGATGAPELDILAWGECYNVDCPFCRDSRGRLSINHRYGAYDAISESNNLHLARCFNEDCLKGEGRYTQLKEMIFGFLNRDQRRGLSFVQQSLKPVVSSATLPKAELPGQVVPLDALPENHLAIQYLRKRQFDPVELAQDWDVGYCYHASSRVSLAQDRLIIPFIEKGTLVGWQARCPDEKPWKMLREPKYFTMPGMPKGRLLYNYEKASNEPVIVVCEGPTDVWRVGPVGVALLGKQATRAQEELLAKLAATKPLVLLLDGDALNDQECLQKQLKDRAPNGLVSLVLPPDQDPGDLTREELWELIYGQAEADGVRLPGACMDRIAGEYCQLILDNSSE